MFKQPGSHSNRNNISCHFDVNGNRQMEVYDPVREVRYQDIKTVDYMNHHLNDLLPSFYDPILKKLLSKPFSLIPGPDEFW